MRNAKQFVFESLEQTMPVRFWQCFIAGLTWLLCVMDKKLMQSERASIPSAIFLLRKYTSDFS
jgi:hypothetical protein